MGVTVLDAGVLIGLLDADDVHHEAARDALGVAFGRHDRLVLPASAFAEVLVGPARRGEHAVSVVREVVDRAPIEIEPLGEEIALAAATLRARHRSLKLPDALVIATAVHLECDHLITTDRGWPSRAELELPALIVTI